VTTTSSRPPLLAQPCRGQTSARRRALWKTGVRHVLGLPARGTSRWWKAAFAARSSTKAGDIVEKHGQVGRSYAGPLVTGRTSSRRLGDSGTRLPPGKATCAAGASDGNVAARTLDEGSRRARSARGADLTGVDGCRATRTSGLGRRRNHHGGVVVTDAAQAMDLEARGRPGGAGRRTRDAG